jgi:hypothetical protein
MWMFYNWESNEIGEEYNILLKHDYNSKLGTFKSRTSLQAEQ